MLVFYRGGRGENHGEQRRNLFAASRRPQKLPQRASGRRKASAIDLGFEIDQTDHLASTVEHGAAAIACVYGGRSLDVMLIVDQPVGIADDSAGHGPIQDGFSQAWAADNNDRFARVDCRFVRQDHVRKLVRTRDFKQRDIQCIVSPDESTA